MPANQVNDGAAALAADEPGGFGGYFQVSGHRASTGTGYQSELDVNQNVTGPNGAGEGRVSDQRAAVPRCVGVKVAEGYIAG